MMKQFFLLHCIIFILRTTTTNGLLTKMRHIRTCDYLHLSRSFQALHELTDGDHESTSSQSQIVSMIDFGNFWRKTAANFTLCDEPDRTPDFKSKGSRGSKYWDMDTHVVRKSDHWSGQHGIGRIVDCTWTIDVVHNKKEFVTGMCKYKDFRRGSLNRKEKINMRKKIKGFSAHNK